jgi:magnesium-transporting ATPase (P-type)
MKTLEDVRGMRAAAFEVQVWREGRWQALSSELLMPGDIISLPRPKQDSQTVPCDALLLRGECVVNESLLTGESVPQIKESLVRLATSGADLTVPLAPQDRHKNYVLFGGTQILLSSWKGSAAAASLDSSSSLPSSSSVSVAASASAVSAASCAVDSADEVAARLSKIESTVAKIKSTEMFHLRHRLQFSFHLHIFFIS